MAGGFWPDLTTCGSIDCPAADADQSDLAFFDADADEAVLEEAELFFEGATSFTCSTSPLCKPSSNEWISTPLRLSEPASPTNSDPLGRALSRQS